MMQLTMHAPVAAMPRTRMNSTPVSQPLRHSVQIKAFAPTRIARQQRRSVRVFAEEARTATGTARCVPRVLGCCAHSTARGLHVFVVIFL